MLADDLDAAGGPLNTALPLTITEPGPIGIFQTSLLSVQEAQSLLRGGGTLPAGTVVGVINQNATLTTANTVGQIQTQLGSTPQGYDVISLLAPPSGYSPAIEAAFQSRVGDTGEVAFDSAASGALIQGGGDTLSGGEDLDAYYFYDYVVRLDTSLANAATGGVGALQYAEGGTVLPQDRLFFRYNYFHNVDYGTPAGSLNRFTPGFEKAFADGLFSLEMRLPFAADAATDPISGSNGITNQSSAEFGKLMVYMKALLWETSTYAWTGGLGLGLPTASDIDLTLADGTPLMRVENDAVQIQPFTGWMYLPNDRWFAQGFSQLSFSTDSNTVSLNQNGSGLQSVGEVDDPSYYFSSLSVGCWAYRNDCADCLTAIIPTLELHGVYSLGDGENLTVGNLQVGNFQGSFNNTSAVAATTFEFNQRSQLSLGYAVPLTDSDRQFDGAFRLHYSLLQ